MFCATIINSARVTVSRECQEFGERLFLAQKTLKECVTIDPKPGLIACYFPDMVKEYGSATKMVMGLALFKPGY